MTSYRIKAILSKYLENSSKTIEILNPFCLEGRGQYIIQHLTVSNRTHIYGTVYNFFNKFTSPLSLTYSS